jgi:hypothetical protein
LTDVLPYKASQEISQTPINDFSLIICLGVVRRVELKDSTKPSPKSAPKMPDDLGITIRGDCLRNAMKLDYFSELQVSNM